MAEAVVGVLFDGQYRADVAGMTLSDFGDLWNDTMDVPTRREALQYVQFEAEDNARQKTRFGDSMLAKHTARHPLWHIRDGKIYLAAEVVLQEHRGCGAYSECARFAMTCTRLHIPRRVSRMNGALAWGELPPYPRWVVEDENPRLSLLGHGIFGRSDSATFTWDLVIDAVDEWDLHLASDNAMPAPHDDCFDVEVCEQLARARVCVCATRFTRRRTRRGPSRA